MTDVSDPVDVEWLIRHFGMDVLPVEAAYFVNTYRSAAKTADGRDAGTAMIGLYCHQPQSRSHFHRLRHDEVWHFYAGDPLRLILLHPDGTSADVILGGDLAAGQRVQYVVPAGVWQAGETIATGVWSLFGCTMAPGFSGEYFESGYADQLVRTHPDRADDIARLGVPEGEPAALPDGFV